MECKMERLTLSIPEAALEHAKSFAEEDYKPLSEWIRDCVLIRIQDRLKKIEPLKIKLQREEARLREKEEREEKRRLREERREAERRMVLDARMDAAAERNKVCAAKMELKAVKDIAAAEKEAFEVYKKILAYCQEKGYPHPLKEGEKKVRVPFKVIRKDQEGIDPVPGDIPPEWSERLYYNKIVEDPECGETWALYNGTTFTPQDPDNPISMWERWRWQFIPRKVFIGGKEIWVRRHSMGQIRQWRYRDERGEWHLIPEKYQERPLKPTPEWKAWLIHNYNNHPQLVRPVLEEMVYRMQTLPFSDDEVEEYDWDVVFS